MKRPQPRSAFGWIFLAFGLGIFYVLGSNSIATELHDILHGRPFTEPLRQKLPAGVNKVLDAVLPAKVDQLPHIQALNGKEAAGKSTNEDPFQQFNVVRWLGWAFIWGALMEVGVAYLRSQKTQVAE